MSTGAGGELDAEMTHLTPSSAAAEEATPAQGRTQRHGTGRRTTAQ